MDLRSIYISNGIGIFILMMLIYAARAKTLRRSTEDRLFTIMTYGVMLGCFMEMFSYAIDGMVFTGSRALNYVANTYLNCANMLLPLCVLAYVDLGLYGDPQRIREKYKPQMIVAAIMLVATVVNLFVPIVFYIDDQNVYERRPFGYVYYAVILYYLISAMLLTRRFEKINGTRTFFNITVFVFPILVGAGLQFMFYGLSVAWLSAAVGLTGLFMMQQNELAYIDALVDTYNRQFLDLMLSSWISRERTFAGALLDVDKFKSINDNFGHTEGDKALKDVTELLKKSRSGGERVFRFAGDEFIILKMTESPDGLAPFLRRLNANLEEFNKGDRLYELSLSYGTSFFDGGDLDTFTKEMDTRMYEMKAEHHKQNPDLVVRNR